MNALICQTDFPAICFLIAHCRFNIGENQFPPFWGLEMKKMIGENIGYGVHAGLFVILNILFHY